MWAILLLTAATVLADNACEQRCSRIYQRSLARVGFDDEKLRTLLEKQRPLGTVKDICWRVHDHLDCMKHCGDSEEHEKFAKFVKAKCRFSLRGIENALSCVSRYHSFMEVRCSTFLKEAERLKAAADPSYTPGQEICRYLHLNTLCLENTVTMYCANAKKIFRRLNFRDYFLSFILPSNDTLFDDLDLDACQLFDFVKKNIKPDKRIDEELTTVINDFEKSEARRRPITTVATSTDRTEFTTLLKELLDESSKVTASTTIPTKSTTWSAPVMRTPTRLTVHPPLKPTRTTITSTRTATSEQPTTSVVTTPSTLTTLTASVRSTPISVSASTDVTDVKNEEDEYDEEKDDEYAEEKPENVSVEVVQIQNMGGTAVVLANATQSSATSTKSRLFSDDSWEEPPPNFGYSSMRYPNGGVTPLYIDTSTYFGMDDDIKDDEDTREESNMGREALLATAPTKETEKKKVDIRKAETIASVAMPVHPTQDLRRSPIYVTQRIQTTSTTTTAPPSSTTTLDATRTTEFVTTVTPLLRGDVVVKRIHEWNDDTRIRELGPLVKEPAGGEAVDEHISTEPIDHTDSSLEVGNTTILPRLNIDWSDRETLILIGSLLIALVIFTLMCILICCVWCRRKRASHDFKTTY